MTTDTTITPPELCALPPVAVACPEWCTHREGHGYELEDQAGFQLRVHARGFTDNDDTLTVEVEAQGTWRGEHEELGPLGLRVSFDGGEVTYLFPAEARRVGAALAAAADFLESGDRA